MKTVAPDNTTPVDHSLGRRTAAASVAALASLLAVTSCCLPIAPFLLAAGAAGSSAIFAALRPYLLGASILFVAYGFYQAWKAKQCRLQPSLLVSLLLWTSAVVVCTSLLFPQLLANFTADLLGR